MGDGVGVQDRGCRMGGCRMGVGRVLDGGWRGGRMGGEGQQQLKTLVAKKIIESTIGGIGGVVGIGGIERWRQLL